jgi:beta-propeller repeat-containing protein
MRAMSSDFFVARVLGGTAAAGGEVLRGSRPAGGRAFSGKKALVVVAVALLALLAAFATLIAASKAPNADHHSSAGTTQDQSRAAAPQMSEREALNAYEKVPLAFVPNEGQTDEAVRYYAQGAGYGFFFTHKGARLSFADGEGRGGHALALDFLGADPGATLEAQKRLSGEVNYLVGDDPAKWQKRLTTHGELLYGGLWPGIDMTVRGEGGNLKYEFHMQPGSSVEDVRLGYRGAKGLSVGTGGELLVQTSLGVLKDAAPVSYQRIAGERVPVQSRYKLTGDGRYGFAVGSYDPRYPLVIDPELDYSTFLGGSRFEDSFDIAVDRTGSAYVTGFTESSNYPTTPGAFDRTLGGINDAFVTKLNASGSALAYSTYLGGAADDAGRGIAVDGMGSAYVTGQTESSNFPTSTGAFDTNFNRSGNADAFVTKLPTG